MARCKRNIQIIGGILYIECSECHNMESEKEYFKGNCAYGLRSKCKECVMKKYADKSLEYRIINKERINRGKREAYKKNRELVSEKRQKKKEQLKIYRDKYYKEHYDEVLKKRRDYRRESGKGKVRTKTERLIKKLGIRPSQCSICGEDTYIEAHHPDHNKRNEIIFVCRRCHSRLDKGWFKCSQDKIIDLLSFNC